MLLGWFSGELGYTRHEDASILATVVVRFALPFHLFIGALNTRPDKIKDFTFMVVLIIGLVGSYFLTLLISRYAFRHDIKTSTIQSLVCTPPDTAHLDTPVLAVLINPEGFLGVLIGNLVTNVLMIPLTIIPIRIGDKHRSVDEPQFCARQLILQSLLKAVRNPITWIPISGILSNLARVQLPPVFSMPTEMMGRIAGGLSLFALELLSYGGCSTINIRTYTSINIKNPIQPVMMILAELTLGLSHTLMQQVIIIGATPSAIMAGMSASRNDAYIESASFSTLLGTAIGVVTGGIMIYFVS